MAIEMEIVVKILIVRGRRKMEEACLYVCVCVCVCVCVALQVEVEIFNFISLSGE